MKTGALIALGVFGLVDYIQRQSEPEIYYVKNIIGGFNGISIPMVGIFIKEDEKGNKMLENHERVHWQQYQEEGVLSFLINYTAEHLKNGYDNNIYEIEARIVSGEQDDCIHRYTECVLTGESLTVSNPNFRNS
ncbi:hypothetical protein [Kordia sp.]|uniref:hypothetical protein n=1 Tax=Kordia sp. TaxID=1965332 RepID=UPI0025B7F761|nr:hypothetical protein [Kordia sp.]MCH2194381.1 hypothetical protein [Kordia sp.]